MLESLRNEFNDWLFKVFEATKGCVFSDISVQVVPNFCASISKGTLTASIGVHLFLRGACSQLILFL